MPRKPRTTLNEVAVRAGVSKTTASLILGGKAIQHRIADETYRRVKQAAEELDYVPNLLVRSLQRGRTHILSFFNAFRHRRDNDLYMDRLSTALEKAGGRYGYDILVHCDFSRPPMETYRFLNGGRADGLLLFAPLPADPLLPLLRASRLPVVLINALDETGCLPSVRDDVHSGMQQVADTLVRLGHRRIAAFTEEGDDFRDARERIDLLRSLLRRQGVIVPDHRIVPFTGNMPPLLRDLMRDPEPPTAIFCWRDRLAYYTLEACETLDIAVPAQLSIVGYDGLQWPAATRHTAASVRVDLDALADAAVSLLDRYIRIHGEAVVPHALPVTLTPGTTLGPPILDSHERRV
jgi:LacI family transcriptional regulator